MEEIEVVELGTDVVSERLGKVTDVVNALMDLVANSVSLADEVRKFTSVYWPSYDDGFVVYTVDGDEFHVQVTSRW